MKKRLFLFMALAFVGCKENDPEISKDFEGTFYSSEKSDIGVLNVEWHISSNGPQLVDINSRIDFKSSSKDYSDVLRIVSLEKVKVESERVLKFDNTYIYDSNKKASITGTGILTGDQLTIDIKEVSADGDVQYTAKVLYRR